MVKRLASEKWECFLPHVQKFLWNKVKHSDQCCCVSKFYCTTLTSLEKCEGCCGKCSDDLGESSSNSDIDTETSTESEEISETADESSAENSSESEDHFDFVSD